MKAIIFGCGGVGVLAKQKLESEGAEIIAFSDNNAQKWNSTIENCKIVNPQEISLLQYDIIAIGLYKAVNTVKEQLLALGIPEEKIVIPIEPNRIFPNPMTLTPNQLEQLERLDLSEYSSLNTKGYLQKNIVIDDEEFLRKLESLKQTLKENRIPREKVCVVSGAVLQAYGLRRSKKFDDIDIIMTSDLRKVYGSGLVIISDIAEMHVQNQYPISDDEIICNGEYHFVFSDLKFMHPRILYEYGRKTKSKEYQLLESYCNFSERNHI